MAATALLDTNILTYLAKGEAAAGVELKSWLANGNGVVIPRVAVYEFRRGVFAGSLGRAEAQLGELFLASFSTAELDAAGWDIAAEIWGALFRTGVKIRKDQDILIAATALRWGYEIATRNQKDFARIVAIRSTLTVHAW